MKPYLSLTLLASILVPASASLAQDRPPPLGATAAPPPLPGPAPQPLPGPAPQPLPGLAPQPPAIFPGQPLPGPPPQPGFVRPAPSDWPPPEPLRPRVIKWNEGEDIPAGYHKGTRIRTGLVIGGSVMFGTAWLPTAVVGSLGGSSPDLLPLLLPVFGPLIVAGRSDTNIQVGGAAVFWLVFDGLQQAGGLAMLIAGAVARETVLLRNDVKEAKTWWMPAPMTFGNQSAGIGFVGTL